jgi:hypothetical protein
MHVQDTAKQEKAPMPLASLQKPWTTVLFSLICAAEIIACPIGFAQASSSSSSSVSSLSTSPPAPVTLAPSPSSPAPAAPAPAAVRTPEAAKEAVKMTPSDLKNYLAVMRPIMHLYLHVMLSIISPDGLPAEDSLDTKVTAQTIEGLQEQLSKVTPPVGLEQQHVAMDDSLNAVLQFAKTGGTSKVGFHTALQLAQLMQSISNKYHDSVLALIQENGLPGSSDPFIVVKVAEKMLPKQGVHSTKGKAPAAVFAPVSAQPFVVPQVTTSDRIHGLSGSSAGVDLDVGSRVPSSASTTPTMIDGVGGSMGLSGMFDGLGGTGTNGLVDGMGFSSGLNGFVNGAGASSGMSGMLNDINTSSASGK